MNIEEMRSLISAYYDDELTTAERATVEHLLATSPAARAELESYRGLSVMLRENARSNWSVDLKSSVMDALQQQPVQGMSTESTSTAAKSTAAGSGMSRHWGRWIALATAAAALLIAVRTAWNPANTAKQVVSSRQAVQTPSTPTNTVPSTPGTSQDVAVVQDQSPRTDSETNLASTDQQSTPPKFVEAPLAVADLPLEVVQDLKRAHPGKIVRFLKQSGSDVAVFHLMVLDTKPGLESLQMILSAQQISGPKNGPVRSGVIAVYVEADQQQLDNVIAELLREEQKQFVALAVQSPMKAEDVQKVVKNSPQELMSQQVPLEQSELQSLGVNPVKTEQLVASLNNRSSRAPAVARAQNGSDSSRRKLLIVLEKAPESFRPKSEQAN